MNSRKECVYEWPKPLFGGIIIMVLCSISNENSLNFPFGNMNLKSGSINRGVQVCVSQQQASILSSRCIVSLFVKLLSSIFFFLLFIIRIQPLDAEGFLC